MLHCSNGALVTFECPTSKLLHDAALLESRDHLVGQDFGPVWPDVEHHFGMLGPLIGLVDAGEIPDLARQGALVEALRIARDAVLDAAHRRTPR